MSKSEVSGVKIGAFDGRAGSMDWGGTVGMADSKVEVVVSDRWTAESGEEMVEVTAIAHLPANDIRMQWELPKYSAERLIESYPD